MANELQELTKSNLSHFLKDSAFVEYFNAFLLLPSFPCHVYYDEHLGVFESVDVEPLESFYATRPTSTCTSSTVYLSESRLNQMTNPVLCQDWVSTQRLPLFVNSDLYSEYKLLKILASSANLFFDTCLKKDEEKRGESRRPMSRRRKQSRHIMSGRTSSTTRRHSLSANRRHQPTALEKTIQILKSKAGMAMFRRFVSGKMGEQDLILWMEVERLRNMVNFTEYLSGLRMKYPDIFLIEEVDMMLPMKKKSNTISKLQHIPINNLKQYWYPQFLASVMNGRGSTSLPMVHSLSSSSALHDRSTLWTPSYRKSKSSHDLCHTHLSSCNNRITSMPRLPNTVHGSRDHASYNRDHASYNNRSISTMGLVEARPDTRYSKSNEGSRRPVSWGQGDMTTVRQMSSRRLWSREREDTPSILRSSRLATYNKYPLVPCGRTSTTPAALESDCSLSSVLPVHPPACPQILSMSGTPVPMESVVKPNYTSLLKCLSFEQRKAGGFFQKHLELIPEEKVHINCLYFWRNVQEYKELFIQCSFSISAIEMKAKIIYGKYIYNDSVDSISCSDDITDSILKRMWPAFEDLFDDAEEHALSILLTQWEKLCELECQIFKNLQNTDGGNDLSIFSLNELDKLSEECDSESGSYSSLGSVGSSYLESGDESRDQDETTLLSHDDNAICDKSDNVSADTQSEKKQVVKEMAFNDLMTNSREMEYFKMYLNVNKAAVHLICWMEIESFRAISASDKAVRNMKAKQLRMKYFNKKYFFGPISPASKELQRQIVGVGGSVKLPKRPSTAVFREAQKHIRLKVEQFVRSFVKTEEFLERTCPTKSAKKKGGKEDLFTNDLLTTRHVESHETILLRKMLANETSRRLFQYYMNTQTAKGSCPAGKQVDFWLEVQRYKTMFHSQMNRKLLQDKMNAILLCYFQSQSPPRLQLNIPASVAEETVKKKFGPYVFRESQMAVFKNIQSYWNEYQNFLEDSKHTTSIEVAIGELKQQIEEERAKMKEQLEIEQERGKLSIPRFETIEEKKQRLKQEQEMKEFGEVAVSFRLSQLNPQFKFYFGDSEESPSTPAPELLAEWISSLKSTSRVKKTVHYESQQNDKTNSKSSIKS